MKWQGGATHRSGMPHLLGSSYTITIGGGPMVAKLKRVALREALPQRVVECAALEMRLYPFQPVVPCSARSCFILVF